MSRSLYMYCTVKKIDVIWQTCKCTQTLWTLCLYDIKIKLHPGTINRYTCLNVWCVRTVVLQQPRRETLEGQMQPYIGNRFQWTLSTSILNFSPFLIKSGDWNQLRYQAWHRLSDCLCHLMGALLQLSFKAIFLPLREETGLWTEAETETGRGRLIKNLLCSFSCVFTTNDLTLLFWVKNKESSFATGRGEYLKDLFSTKHCGFV